MNKLFPVLLIVSALLAGCASGGRPNWTDGGKSKNFPPDRYLTGMGTAPALDTAKARARASLAKTVSINIGDVKEEVSRQAGKDGSRVLPYVNEARVNQLITNRSTQVLTGTRIGETWQGPETKAHYVLAVLPRLQAGNNLKQEIARLDRATGEYVRRSKGEGDILKRVRAASIALDAQVARLGYERTLHRVSGREAAAASQWNIVGLSGDLERLLRRVRIAPQVADDSTGSLGTSTSTALSKSGFQVSDGESAEFILNARLKFENLGYKDKWHWSRGVLTVKLSERASGRERGSVSWAIKASGHSIADAEQRIATKVDTLLNRQLRDTIIRFAVR
jgi:hypothetical protein